MRVVAIAALGLLAACQQPAANETAAVENGGANGTAVGGPAETASAGSVAAAAAPPTREAALKLMHDRHENMEKIGDATKAVSRTLKSGSPDLAVIRSAAATYTQLAPKVPTWFPPGTGPDVGKTDALPAIWEKPQDFQQKARDFQGAATAFNAAAKSGDMAAINKAFGDLGKSCKACHDPYRAKDE